MSFYSSDSFIYLISWHIYIVREKDINFNFQCNYYIIFEPDKVLYSQNMKR
jgi:hypothetical protein